jgi:hypothetical protein
MAEYGLNLDGLGLDAGERREIVKRVEDVVRKAEDRSFKAGFNRGFDDAKATAIDKITMMRRDDGPAH